MWLVSRSVRPEPTSLATPKASRAAATLLCQHLGLRGMGKRKMGVGGDGSVIYFAGAGVEGQRQIASLDIGLPLGARCGG